MLTQSVDTRSRAHSGVVAKEGHDRYKQQVDPLPQRAVLVRTHCLALGVVLTDSRARPAMASHGLQASVYQVGYPQAVDCVGSHPAVLESPST